MLVLVANEPRSYREALAEAFKTCRPNIDVRTVEPGALAGEISRLNPDVVVCNQATDTMRSRNLTWVELYPWGEPQSVVSINGVCSELEDVQLSDLLSVIDQTEKLPHLG